MILPTSMAATVLSALARKPQAETTLARNTKFPAAQVRAQLRLLVANGWAENPCPPKNDSYTATQHFITPRGQLLNERLEAQRKAQAAGVLK